MERALKKVLAALPSLPYMIEVGNEVTPDGTWPAVLGPTFQRSYTNG